MKHFLGPVCDIWPSVEVETWSLTKTTQTLSESYSDKRSPGDYIIAQTYLVYNHGKADLSMHRLWWKAIDSYQTGESIG